MVPLFEMHSYNLTINPSFASPVKNKKNKTHTRTHELPAFSSQFATLIGWH